jgi:phosphotransferase system enzyme I (PtsI)
MGIRGIRYLLNNKELLISHLLSVLRISQLGTINVLIPFITLPSELSALRSIINKIIIGERLDHSKIKIGIMIETPSSMMMLYQFKNLDFISLGTNDLTQFLFASDRENYSLDFIREDAAPLLIHCIKTLMHICNGLRKEVTICGEIASIPELVPLLIGAGIRRLSVQPSMVGKIKKIIESRTIDQTVAEVNDYLRPFSFAF